MSKEVSLQWFQECYNLDQSRILFITHRFCNNAAIRKKYYDLDQFHMSFKVSTILKTRSIECCSITRQNLFELIAGGYYWSSKQRVIRVRLFLYVQRRVLGSDRIERARRGEPSYEYETNRADRSIWVRMNE